MFRNVVAAMNEALDISLHLKPLRSHFKVILFIMYCIQTIVIVMISSQIIEESEYTDLRPLFSPLFHVICLIYSNSKYYSSQARIIVLLQVSLQSILHCQNLQLLGLLYFHCLDHHPPNPTWLVKYSDKKNIRKLCLVLLVAHSATQYMSLCVCLSVCVCVCHTVSNQQFSLESLRSQWLPKGSQWFHISF